MSRTLKCEIIATNKHLKGKKEPAVELYAQIYKWLEEIELSLDNKVEIRTTKPYLLEWNPEVEGEATILQVRVVFYINKIKGVKITWNNIMGEINKVKVAYFDFK